MRSFKVLELIRLSWRAIGQKLNIPAMTALDSYRQPGARSSDESCSALHISVEDGKNPRVVAAN